MTVYGEGVAAAGDLAILFLTMEYAPETGNGIGSYHAVLAPALAARGHVVHVVSCVPGQRRRDYVERGVRIHRRGQLWVPGLSRLPRRGGLRAGGARLRTVASTALAMGELDLDVDVVEAPDWMAEGLIVGMRGCTPLVVHLHTPLVVTSRYGGHPIGRWNAANILERAAARCAHMLTAPSQLLIDMMDEEGWLERADARVVRLPVDSPQRTGPGPVADTAPVVLAAGRLEPLKAPDTLIHAAALLTAQVPDLRLVFVGRPASVDYGAYLAALARRLGVSCTFAGQIPRPSLCESYASARVVVLASRYENFPMTALEAMASARPVVTTARTGIAELLRDSGAGSVVPADRPDALAAAMRPFLTDRELAAAAGARGRAIVREHCAPDRIAAEREACYRDAIGRWKTRSRRGRVRGA